MEIIEKIEEVAGYKLSGKNYGSYSGYLVETNEKQIYLLIDDQQDCCENWGYLMSEDEDQIHTFIGNQLLSVDTVDTLLEVKNLEWIKEEYEKSAGYDQCDTMFININTNLGTLQFVAYNIHNGYYGHDMTFEIIKKES